MYVAREKKTAWPVKPAATKRTGRTNGVMGGGGGTFLTGMDGADDGYDDPREAALRERRKQQAMASAGQKVLRSRVQGKKAKGQELLAGQRRHEAAMNEMKRRKEEASRRKPKEVQTRANIGASAGIKTKNRHMADFQNMKDGFNRRKEDLLRGPKAIKSTIGSKQVATKRGMGARLGSNSAPAGSVATDGLQGAGVGVKGVLAARRGMPATQKG